MNLHGDFAGPELGSYLFIEHARNDQGHDLAFACGQRLVALTQFGKLNVLMTNHPVSVQSLVNRIQQVLVSKGLGQEFDRAGFHGLHGHRNISVPGDEDDRNAQAGVSQLALKIQTVNSRKSYVQNQAAWTVGPLAAQEILRRCEGLRLQAHRLQHALDSRAHQVIVINDEYGGRTCWRHSVPRMSLRNTVKNMIAQ